MNSLHSQFTIFVLAVNGCFTGKQKFVNWTEEEVNRMSWDE